MFHQTISIKNEKIIMRKCIFISQLIKKKYIFEPIVELYSNN